MGGVGGLAPVREEKGRHDRVRRGGARRVRRGGAGGGVVVSHPSGRRRGGGVASVGEQQGAPAEEEPGTLNLRGRAVRKGGDPRGGSTAALVWGVRYVAVLSVIGDGVTALAPAPLLGHLRTPLPTTPLPVSAVSDQRSSPAAASTPPNHGVQHGPAPFLSFQKGEKRYLICQVGPSKLKNRTRVILYILRLP
jgi:hypothetical protein